MRPKLLIALRLLNQATHSSNVSLHRSARLKAKTSDISTNNTALVKLGDRGKVTLLYNASLNNSPAFCLFSKPKRSTMGFDVSLSSKKNPEPILSKYNQKPTTLQGGVTSTVAYGSFFKFKPRAKDYIWHLSCMGSAQFSWSRFFRRNSHVTKNAILQRSLTISILPNTPTLRNAVTVLQTGFAGSAFQFCAEHYRGNPWQVWCSFLNDTPHTVSSVGVADRSSKQVAIFCSLDAALTPLLMQININYLKTAGLLNLTNLGVSDQTAKLRIVFHEKKKSGARVGVCDMQGLVPTDGSCWSEFSTACTDVDTYFLLELYLLCCKLYFF